MAGVREIDTVNIYHAALLAMRRAVESLPRQPQHMLVDARTVPGVAIPQNKFDKGDGINFSIAAASIIAKTERDHMMDALDQEYPGYGFADTRDTPPRSIGAHSRSSARRPSIAMSFPVIHEMRGEFSPLFYALKEQLLAAATRAGLAEIEAAVAAQELPERECGRLRLLIERRWKAFG